MRTHARVMDPTVPAPSRLLTEKRQLRLDAIGTSRVSHRAGVEELFKSTSVMSCHSPQ